MKSRFRTALPFLTSALASTLVGCAAGRGVQEEGRERSDASDVEEGMDAADASTDSSGDAQTDSDAPADAPDSGDELDDLGETSDAGDPDEGGDLETSDTPSDVDVAELPEFAGPPEITHVFPQIILSDGLVYVEGNQLALAPDNADDVVTTVFGRDSGGVEVVIPMAIVLGRPQLLVLRAPRDFAERLSGAGGLDVTTPAGFDQFSPVFATNDTTFAGKTPPGAGLLGNVYQLQPNTQNLPNLDAPCSDPAVVTGSVPCPYTSLIASALNVTPRDFSAGFPGLGTTLLEWFAIRFNGYLVAETAGLYEFQSCSDDGSKFYLSPSGSRALVIDNDGQHSDACVSGTLSLEAGVIPFVYDYFQGPAQHIGMRLFWKPPGVTEFAIIPDTALRIFPELLE